MWLYKYLHPDRTDVIKNLTIRFSQVSALNDPFELCPHLSGLASKEDLRRQIEEELGRIIYLEYEKLNPQVKSLISLSDFSEKISANFPNILPLIEQPATLFTSSVKSALSSFGEKVGMLCLSENPDSLLMWAHYADSHRGYVIQFDAENKFFDQRITSEDLLRSLKKVVYKDVRPSTYVYDMSDIDYLLTKGLEWEYEAEWRMFLPLDMADSKIKIGNDTICLYKYPPEAIKSIIFGCRMSEEKKSEIIGALKDSAMCEHVQLFQSDISGEKYSLNISELLRH